MSSKHDDYASQAGEDYTAVFFLFFACAIGAFTSQVNTKLFKGAIPYTVIVFVEGILIAEIAAAADKTNIIDTALGIWYSMKSSRPFFSRP